MSSDTWNLTEYELTAPSPASPMNSTGNILLMPLQPLHLMLPYPGTSAFLHRIPRAPSILCSFPIWWQSFARFYEAALPSLNEVLCFAAIPRDWLGTRGFPLWSCQSKENIQHLQGVVNSVHHPAADDSPWKQPGFTSSHIKLSLFLKTEWRLSG